MIPVRFDGFSAILRLEKFEIHNVVLHVSNLDPAKNLLPNLLAELCSTAFINCYWKPELSISIIDKIQISGKHNEKKGACHDKE